MLQNEAALASVERADNTFHRDVACGSFDLGLGRDHFALAGANEIAMKLLVDGHSAEVRGFRYIAVGLLWNQFHVERSGGMLSHRRLLLNRFFRRWAGLTMGKSG